MLQNLKMLPPDPILGLMTAYAKDTNPNKIDLGVGVYQDDSGDTPVMAAVKAAEGKILETEMSKSYLPPAGTAEFNHGILELLLGSEHKVLKEQRAQSVQTPGGCGALRIGAEVIKRSSPGARIWVGDPTWPNHIPLIGSAGLQFEQYAYYDTENHRINFDAMMQALSQAGPDDVALLHGCCHNPSGADLNMQQWQEITELVLKNGCTPFVDIAYQGLGAGLDEDAAGLRYMAARVPELLIASSCSKNFALYRERTGALVLISNTPSQAEAAKSQALNIARQSYSMPPSHGATTAGLIMNDNTMRHLWYSELESMRNRLSTIRKEASKHLNRNNQGLNFDFIGDQSGMFSFLGISADQVKRLRSEFGIYMADSTRINLAGLNSRNIEYFGQSVCSVL